jgi:hypothetical protein
MNMAPPAGCCVCGLTVEALVETAHIPDRRAAPDETARLCILCHRAYDLGLMTHDEIKAARTRWLTGEGAPYPPAELHALWTSRKSDWTRLHKATQAASGLTNLLRSYLTLPVVFSL